MSPRLKLAFGLLLFMVVAGIIGNGVFQLHENMRAEPSLAEITARAEEHIPRVEAAGAEQRQRIQETIYPSYRVRAAYALKAASQTSAFYVAARVSGPMVGYDKTSIGVWLVDEAKDSLGAVVSLNRAARRYSSASVSNEAVREILPKNPEARAVAMVVEAELKR